MQGAVNRIIGRGTMPGLVISNTHFNLFACLLLGAKKLIPEIYVLYGLFDVSNIAHKMKDYKIS